MEKKQEQQASATAIRIENHDMPIYRIFSLEFFEDILRTKKLTFIQPKKWEDPYEIIGNCIKVTFETDDEQKSVIINQELPPIFAQCWSATEHSDTLFRAYSRVVKDKHSQKNTCPKEEGIRIKTTPRKLMQALLSKSPKNLPGDWFIGAVEYLPQDEVLNRIGNAIKGKGLAVYSDPKQRARLMLLKREAFYHENEQRVLFVPNDKDSVGEVLQIDIDPNEVFEEVFFDPRVDMFEREEREKNIKKLGFRGNIKRSDLYQGTLLHVELGKWAAS
ncbi:hypothetical protein ACSL9G_003033 [Vibrio fluvialis]